MRWRTCLTTLVVVCLCARSVEGASAGHLVTNNSSTNTTTYTTNSFTYTVDELLVVLVAATATTVGVAAVTSSVGTTFTLAASATKNGSADVLLLFVANALGTTVTSQTVTFTCTGDAATGASVSVYWVSGLTRSGLSAVLQTATQSNQAATGTPAPTFGAAVNTNSPTIGFVSNAANAASLTPPTGWTEDNDSGYATPTTGKESVHRDSGFTGTTVTWGSASGTAFGSVIVEFDTSAAPTAVNRLLLGVGR